MTNLTPEQFAANAMAAAAHLLTGQPGRADELSDHVAVIVGGPLNGAPLINWLDWVRTSGRQIIHFSWPDANIPVPQVALVCDIGGQARAFEDCGLWMSQSGGSAYLVPNDPAWGAYRIGSDFCLRHHVRQPFATAKAAEAGYVRAYTRLLDIMRHQIDSGLQLPPLLKLQQRTA